MKTKVLVDIKVIANIDQAISYRGTLEDYSRQAESLAREFNSFVRDHRSMDWVYLGVEREYEEQCSHCHHTWEVDSEGIPVCCDKAIEEHMKPSHDS